MARTKAGKIELPSEKRNDRAAKRIKRRESPVKTHQELIPMIERLHWYALRTPAQKEFIAQELLTQKGLVTYCPTDRRWRKRNRFTKTKELISYSMLPRTVFVGFEPGTPLWFNLFLMPCISSVVGIRGEPMRLDNKGMMNLITKWANGVQRPKEEQHMETGKEFHAGDIVRVTDGPFVGMIVPVTDIRGKEARVFLELFGAEHEVAISTWALEAA